MNERDLLIQELIKEKGGTRAQYLHLLDAIANHETGGTNSPTQKQVGGGPGRGKYQFEVGKGRGGITAARRLKNYYTKNNKPIPYWLRKANKGDSLDASELTSEQQDLLFLGDKREHPKADFAKVWNEEQNITDFWAENHWSGKKRDRKVRTDKFNKDYKTFSETNQYPLLEGPKNENISDERRFPTESPSLENNFQTKFANGGYTDPPAQNSAATTTPDTVQTGKDFVTNWMAHPETRKRYRANINEMKGTTDTNLGIDNPVFQKGLTNLKYTRSKIKDPIKDTYGRYNPFGMNIEFFGKPSEGTATHEFTHAAGDIGNDLSTFLMRKYGLLRALRGKHGQSTRDALNTEFGADADRQLRQAEYMGQHGELYPRIMEMRQFLNVKPGQPIDDDMIKRLMENEKTRKTGRFYKPEVLKDMLNTVATTNTGGNTNMAAYGGSLKTALYGNKNLNSYNTGGTHETNKKYKGIPMGIGSNGKQNTVEQGETSFKLKKGKYIFSDRVLLNGNVRDNLLNG